MKSLICPGVNVLPVVQYVILYFLLTATCCRGERFHFGDHSSTFRSLFSKDSVSFPRMFRSFIRPIAQNSTKQLSSFRRDDGDDTSRECEDIDFKMFNREESDNDNDDNSLSWTKLTNYFSSFLSSTENAWEYVESVRHQIHRFAQSTRQARVLSSNRQSIPQQFYEPESITIDNDRRNGLFYRPLRHKNVSFVGTGIFENILISVVKFSGMLVTIQSASLFLRSNAGEVCQMNFQDFNSFCDRCILVFSSIT